MIVKLSTVVFFWAFILGVFVFFLKAIDAIPIDWLCVIYLWIVIISALIIKWAFLLKKCLTKKILLNER